ncbi:TPA: hypothetical protein U2L42_002557 [Citrobacter amalonaticus]|uniref:hypothetical protein n=1 Tax=Citrobacter TaxID=544 RepID=UPI00049FC576|nr:MULTISPECIES: hypothetical protein [Citrobacter]ELN9499222.1 hypothetical protein [Citrobacter amalonaticus]ELW9347356.1 hypothetical protein [Citrobacter amalonaticus]KDF11754.1 hypothetical protein AF41_00926 [Citrobacter sp. MGH 55]WQJ84455.1 hypothetical protein U4W25_01385 [Citrobacter amalonaticus]GJK86729.1 hypothetical protein TUM17567_30240 [Citrobacter amalonaticus]
MYKNIFFIIFIISSLTFPNESCGFIKYGYGRFSGIDRPFIYILHPDDDNHYFGISLLQSNKSQLQHNLYTHLSVKRKEHKIISVVTFLNKSEKSYFIHRNRLTLDTEGGSFHSFSQMCGETFLITTNTIRLDYLGSRCEFDRYYFDNDWVEIPSHRSISFNFIISDVYVFLPGKHRYNFGSLEFYVTDSKWITIKKINRLMFDIFQYKYKAFSQPEHGYLFPLEERHYDHEQYDIRELFQSLNLNGGQGNMYFNIRTNQLIIDIDGNEVDNIPYIKKYGKRYR